MSALAIVAHPDDEVLGCGGTIARLTGQGDKVHVAVLARSRVPLAHAARAVEHLGAGKTLGGLPDQRLDTIPLLSITRMIEAMIARLKPDTVYTHHPGDLNLDHQITTRAVLTACRPVSDCLVKTIYAIEIPSSTEWGDGSFHPTTFVDITATLERKIEAMKMYETECRQWPHPRSPQALRDLAHWRGATAGLEAAEAFQLLRDIRA